MEMFIKVTPVILGFFWLCFGMSVKTQNFKSKIVFNILPFFSGLFSLFVGCKLMGWI